MKKFVGEIYKERLFSRFHRIKRYFLNDTFIDKA